MSLIKGMHHISLTCESQEVYEEEMQFYEKVLKIPVIRQWDAGVMFDTGSGLIEIFHKQEQRLEKGVIRHFALATDDVDACVKAVSDAGYEVFLAPKDIVIGSTPAFPARIAFCRGPLGEEIEFFQERR